MEDDAPKALGADSPWTSWNSATMTLTHAAMTAPSNGPDEGLGGVDHFEAGSGLTLPAVLIEQLIISF